MGIGQDITAYDSPCYSFVTGPTLAEYRRIAALSDAGVANEVATHPKPPPSYVHPLYLFLPGLRVVSTTAAHLPVERTSTYYSEL